MFCCQGTIQAELFTICSEASLANTALSGCSVVKESTCAACLLSILIKLDFRTGWLGNWFILNDGSGLLGREATVDTATFISNGVFIEVLDLEHVLNRTPGLERIDFGKSEKKLVVLGINRTGPIRQRKA
jgi:hypothetical protein